MRIVGLKESWPNEAGDFVRECKALVGRGYVRALRIRPARVVTKEI